MKIRVPLFLAISLAIVIVGLAGFLLLSARIAYRRQATAGYEGARSLWQEKGSSSYRIVVISNSHTQQTGGRNEIRVQAGEIAEAHNPNCTSCTLGKFVALTVEGLFQRISTECLRDFPQQYCNVKYDEDLGFPRRIDTYPYNRDGQERPSITVE
ncbi:MAG TPA: DUF6174 domain-containing protein, partial [Anaerolineales bacterium]